MESFKQFLSKEIIQRRSIIKNQKKSLLNEGLIISYDKDSLISSIFQKYKNYIKLIENTPLFPNLVKKNKFGCTAFQIGIAFSPDFSNQKELKKILETYGYFITKITKEIINKEVCDFYVIEPKYPTLFSVPDNVELYHITPIKNLKRIKKIGLTSKESQTTFKHTGNRIYLLSSASIFYCETFKKELSKDKNIPMDMMKILKIDKSILNKLNLFIDESFTHLDGKLYGCFTLTNIPPHYIIIL